MDTVGFINGNNSKIVGKNSDLKISSHRRQTAVSRAMNTDMRSVTLISANTEV